MNTEGGPYQKLSPHTKRNYRRYLDRFTPFRDCLVSTIRPDHIQDLAEKLLKTPAAAKNFGKLARVLFEYAKKKRLIASNLPRPLLTAYMLGRYTGQREGDILDWTRAVYDGEKLTFRQSKTYSRTKAAMTIYTPTRLKTYLDALVRESTGSLYFVSMSDGAPYNDANFRRQFRAALDSCGLRDLTFHGLRHACGVTLAELGRSQDEIMAYLGHSSPAMTAWYCKQASRKKMQKSAADAWSKAGKE